MGWDATWFVPETTCPFPQTSWETPVLVIGPVSKLGTKGGLSPTHMDLSTGILRSPSPTETSLADRPSQTLRMAAGRDLRAPGGGAPPVTPAEFRSPASRHPAQFRACGRMDAAGPSWAQLTGTTGPRLYHLFQEKERHQCLPLGPAWV